LAAIHAWAMSMMVIGALPWRKVIAGIDRYADHHAADATLQGHARERDLGQRQLGPRLRGLGTRRLYLTGSESNTVDTAAGIEKTGLRGQNPALGNGNVLGAIAVFEKIEHRLF
jgi:hypothetical protein